MRGWWPVALAMVLALGIVPDLMMPAVQGKFWWSHIPGSYALLALVSCLALMTGAKLLSSYWLQRPEDYYERDGSDD